MYEALKEAFRSDGTPSVAVSDSDISAGRLLCPDASPKYPILISLASEAIDDAEIAPLRNYVAAGGFLFVGSSALSRHPDGTTRGDFALAQEMGLHMVNRSLQNWYQNDSFTKVAENRLTAHIPAGRLLWRMPLGAEEIPIALAANGRHYPRSTHFAWQVQAGDAEALAEGKSCPLLATKSFGKGRFIYFGVMQPILGHGSFDSGMYSYVIFRRAVEWAFEAANIPLVKLSPWRFQHDAAFIIRHDFENYTYAIQNIETSAQVENSLGAKGDYYFCTGQLREAMGNSPQTIASLRRAVTLYGATIGSHNGGLPSPIEPGISPEAYDYWHWGPDEVLDVMPPGHASGRAYAWASVSQSFQDIEGWLWGVDNGRPGCGADGSCPRMWVSPFFDATREDSYEILDQLHANTVGEEKIGPFPHWTVSTRTRGGRHTHLSLPVSDWYPGTSEKGVGVEVIQALDYHVTSSIREAIDFYYGLGALINIYGHALSATPNTYEYITYNLSKQRMWAANAAEVYDWWQLRSKVLLEPSYTATSDMVTVRATASGAADSDTAVEIVIPNWVSVASADIQVLSNDKPAHPSTYRITSYGLKMKVGTASSSIELRYRLPNSRYRPPTHRR
jgi:hypothetical protein